jgi:hypothetical protein
VLKSVQLPPVDSEREVPGMVRYQVEKELPFSIDEAVVDFTMEDHHHTGSNGNGNGNGNDESHDGQNVLVAAVRNSVVDHYLAVADAAGVKLQQLGLRPYADVRCLEACVASKATQSNVVLVHLTADEAEINVLIKGSLAFSRSAPIKTNGDAPPDVPGALAVEVVRSLQSVHAIQHGAKIERVWVVGGTGLEADLSKTLSSRLSVPCDQLDAIEALHIKKARVEGDGFITAIGLAIGHNGLGLPLDFLHPKKPPIERDMKKVRSFGAVAAAIIFVLAWVLYGVIHIGGLKADRDSLVNEYNQLEKDNRPVKKLGKRVSSIESWVESSNDWVDHWANLSGLFPSAKDVYLTKIQTNPNGTIGLTVKSRSSNVITELSEQLREAGYGVKLGSESTNADDLGYRYSTSVTLTPGAKMEIDVAKIEKVSRPEDDGSFDMIRRGSNGSSRYKSRGGRR